VVRLPGPYFAYEPDRAAPEPALTPHEGIAFASINRACKISPQTAAAWGIIIGADPAHRLQVLAHGGERNLELRQMLEGAGIPGEALTLVPRCSRAQFLERLNAIDVVLDPWPYNGHTTTCDALWQGVPVVTLCGDEMRGRVGLTIACAAGDGIHAAYGVTDYVQAALTLTSSGQTSDAMRRSIRESMRRSSLLDGRRVARQLEAAYTALALEGAIGEVR
jgi:predicted O-linked N-acetylglucosamine transferase (SPINDLY family)